MLSGRRETIDYVGAMAEQLRAMARDEKLDMLAYLLEMVSIEARDVLKRGDGV